MLENIKNKKKYSEEFYITEQEYNFLLDNILDVDIWKRERNSGYLSITSIIRKK